MDTAVHTLLVLGGTSDIGRATAKAFAARGWTVQLAGRDAVALRREADDIAIVGAGEVSVHPFDVLETANLPGFIESLPCLPDVAVCVIGWLGDQTAAESDLDAAIAILRSNFEGPALALGVLAQRFAARGSGTLVGVSSVAGDRGRASNYVYGSAKAGFSTFLSGLRNRLAKRGVHVVTVKPGFVRTRMTRDMVLPAAVTAAPSEVAEAIFGAIERRRNVVYVRPIWKYIMLIIRHIPENIFKTLKL